MINITHHFRTIVRKPSVDLFNRCILNCVVIDSIITMCKMIQEYFHNFLSVSLLILMIYRTRKGKMKCQIKITCFLHCVISIAENMRSSLQSRRYSSFYTDIIKMDFSIQKVMCLFFFNYCQVWSMHSVVHVALIFCTISRIKNSYEVFLIALNSGNSLGSSFYIYHSSYNIYHIDSIPRSMGHKLLPHS